MGRFVLSMAVPGFSFYDAGWPRIGMGAMISWVLALCIFLMFLGYVTANIAFGMMTSMHVSSIIFVLNRAAPEMSVFRRLALSLAVLLVVGQLVYASGLNWLQNHLFMPVRMGSKVFVINRASAIESIRRGDVVACQTDAVIEGMVRIRDGYILDRVLAGPEDKVEFRASTFTVNGAAAAALPLMPVQGGVVLPAKTWLIWPSLQRITRVNVPDDDIAQAVLSMAMVPREKVIGKPFRRWFWRKQIS